MGVVRTVMSAARCIEPIAGARPRFAGWVKPPRPADPTAVPDPLDFVVCPDGHHISRRRLIGFNESSVIRCNWSDNTPSACAPQCNRFLLVVKVLRPVALDSGDLLRRIYVVELDAREVKYLETAREGIDVYDTLAWLGCDYSPVRCAR